MNPTSPMNTSVLPYLKEQFRYHLRVRNNSLHNTRPDLKTLLSIPSPHYPTYSFWNWHIALWKKNKGHANWLLLRPSDVLVRSKKSLIRKERFQDWWTHWLLSPCAKSSNSNATEKVSGNHTRLSSRLSTIHWHYHTWKPIAAYLYIMFQVLLTSKSVCEISSSRHNRVVSTTSDSPDLCLFFNIIFIFFQEGCQTKLCAGCAIEYPLWNVE